MRWSLSALAVLVLLVSGCTEVAQPKAEDQTPTQAPPAESSADTGGLEVRVLDDSQLPISGASLGLMKTNLTGTTDASGRATFSKVAPGSYDLVVSALGFEPLGRRVQVKAAEITPVVLTLKALASVEGYHESVVFNGYIQAGEGFTDILTNGMPVGCQKCEFRFNASKNAEAFLFEVDFTPTIRNPTGRTILSHQVWDEGTDKNYRTGSWEPRGRFALEKKTAGWPEAGQKFRMINYCDALFVCVDQKYDVWLTTFYNMALNETVTALPPPS
jgi:hypothetical protein